MEFPKSATTLSRDIYTVSRLNREVKVLLEDGFPPVWIEGEISNLSRPASGHVYFSLKDAQAQVRCAFFRQHHRQLGIVLRDGLHVLTRARVSLYEGRGDYQIIVEYLEEAGEGALRRAFDALKLRLFREGLFDEARKKPLPRLPHRIGIVTSTSGAVLHDILTTLRRRFPAIGVMVYPTPVQGESAAEKIAAAIQLADTRRECEVLILARGGGSLEDLWPFNEEIVARAVSACSIPIVSGVGHEMDFTIADMVADARAPTPTAAAEMLSPDQKEWLAQFARIESRIITEIRNHLRNRTQHLDWLSARVVHPSHRLMLLQQAFTTIYQRLKSAQISALRQSSSRWQTSMARLLQHSPQSKLQDVAHLRHHLSSRLIVAIDRELERSNFRLRQILQSLQTLSPLATLARGYAIVQRPVTGLIVTDAKVIKTGERIRARLARGSLDCLVEESREE